MLRSILERLFNRQQSHPTSKVYVGQGTIYQTVQAIRSFSSLKDPHEGIAYWAGIQLTETVVVTSVLIPDAYTTSGSFCVSARANADITRNIMNNNLCFIGQVHSHPGPSVDHSEGDDANALFPCDGFLSIVVPDYGRMGMLPIADCGVHLYNKGRFERKGSDWLTRNFVVVPSILDLRGKETSLYV